MTTLRFTRVSAGTVVSSELTDRTITVNPHPMHFLVPPTFSRETLAMAAETWGELEADLSKPTRYCCAGILAWARAELFAADTPERFAETVDELACAILAVSSGRPGPPAAGVARLRPFGRGELTRATELLFVLNGRQCLLCPSVDLRAPVFAVGKLVDDPTAAKLLGSAAKVMEDVLACAGVNNHIVRPSLVKLLLTTQGVVEVGDLTPATLAPLRAAFLRDNAEMDAEVRALGVEPFLRFDFTNKRLLLALQKAQHARYGADKARQVPAHYHDIRGSDGTGAKGRPGAGMDAKNRAEFPFIARTFPDHGAWVVALRGHVGNLGNRVDLQATVSPLDTMMRDLLARPGVPSTPVEFCAMGAPAAEILQASINSPKRKDTRRGAYITQADLFFEYVLNTDGLLPDGSRDPRLGNPVQYIQRPRRRRRGQSHRRAMPPWLVRAAIDCIAADDYAWPRTRVDDYFNVSTPSGTTRKWSPVLAELTLLRFMVPLRVMSARLLGSGEGDTWIWQEGAALGEGRWTLNEGKWRPRAGEDRAHGFLRRIWDATTSTWTTGLYISSNKTADRENGFDDLGYEVGWASPEIIALFERVRGFQAKYNPARPPKSRVEFKTDPLHASPDVAARLPRLHYLFRDRCDVECPDEPVKRARVRSFWVALMTELERRFAADPSGPREEDGSPLRLVRGQSAEFDLHSVRVTGITALAVNGCPIEVVMMLAGHATFLMTMRYVKLSPADLRQAMNRAHERMEAAEGDTWQADLAELGEDVVATIRVPNSAAGLAQLERERAAFVQHMDIGLCPNGGAMCNEGGPEEKKGVHGPVPGGATNCQSCRFLVSGPQFLGGLIARLNKLSADIIEAGAALRHAEGRRREAVAAQRRAVEPSAKLASDLRRAEARVLAEEERAAVLATSWQNLLGLIRRCEAALREYMTKRDEAEAGNSRTLVVLNGTLDDFHVQLERSSEFDLLQRICENADVYALDARHAARVRGARLDRMLAADGRPAVFAGLTEEESRAVGNLFARWLRARLGVTTVNEVMEGRRTLAEAGVLEDADQWLASAAPGVKSTGGVPGRVLPAAPLRRLASGEEVGG